MTELLNRLRRAGIRFLNQGGSETLSQHRFKSKFAAFEARAMALLVYGA